MLEVLFMKKVLLDKKEIYKITNNFRLAILDAKEDVQYIHDSKYKRQLVLNRSVLQHFF